MTVQLSVQEDRLLYAISKVVLNRIVVSSHPVGSVLSEVDAESPKPPDGTLLTFLPPCFAGRYESNV